MNAILTIAKRDLISLFLSPKAATIFFFFIALMSFFFYSFLVSFIESNAQAMSTGGIPPNLEQMTRAIFYNLHFTLILIIPAISMGSFAEEKKSQSIRMLMTAPVTSFQIVMGKFLSTLSLMSIVLVASTIFPAYLLYYGNPDIKVILCSYLGIFLIICSQLSFGLWISSLTNSQIMAFIFTMFGLFILMVLNWLTPSITGNGIVESIFKYMASTDHLDVFLKGVISSVDLLYFLLFTGLFLFFTNITIDLQRWR